MSNVVPYLPVFISPRNSDTELKLSQQSSGIQCNLVSYKYATKSGGVALIFLKMWGLLPWFAKTRSSILNASKLRKCSHYMLQYIHLCLILSFLSLLGYACYYQNVITWAIVSDLYAGINYAILYFLCKKLIKHKKLKDYLYSKQGCSTYIAFGAFFIFAYTAGNSIHIFMQQIILFKMCFINTIKTFVANTKTKWLACALYVGVASKNKHKTKHAY